MYAVLLIFVLSFNLVSSDVANVQQLLERVDVLERKLERVDMLEMKLVTWHLQDRYKQAYSQSKIPKIMYM